MKQSRSVSSRTTPGSDSHASDAGSTRAAATTLAAVASRGRTLTSTCVGGASAADRADVSREASEIVGTGAPNALELESAPGGCLASHSPV